MLEYSRPIPTAAAPVALFWEPVNVFIGGYVPYDVCVQMIAAIVDAQLKAMQSGGVIEYHIGSRGLKRFDLKQLADFLTYWRNAAQDALLGGSSIQTRRAVPCDC